MISSNFHIILSTIIGIVFMVTIGYFVCKYIIGKNIGRVKFYLYESNK